MITGWADFRLPKAGAGRSERKYQASADDKGKHWRPTAIHRQNQMQETFQAGRNDNLGFFLRFADQGRSRELHTSGPKEGI